MAVPNTPAVSVIIPVYNAEKYLRECLDGVTGQTLTDLEIICVDDGSADGSVRILEEYRQKDPRIQIIRQKNQGAGVARNTGLKAAKGEYLAFLDADDRFERDMLREAYSRCAETGADICAFAADSFDANNGAVSSYHAAFDKRYIPGTNPFDPASDETHEIILQMFNGVPWSKIFRNAFIRNADLLFQPLRTTNDAFFVYSALCKAKKIVTLDRVLVHRRKNNASSLTQTRDKSSLCFYEALAAIQKELKRSGIYERFERSFVNRALQNIIWNMETVSPENAVRIAEHMKETGFRELELDRYDASFFHDRKLYEKYCWMRDLDPAPFCAVLGIVRERDELKRENTRLARELDLVRNSKSYRLVHKIGSLIKG